MEPSKFSASTAFFCSFFALFPPVFCVLFPYFSPIYVPYLIFQDGLWYIYWFILKIICTELSAFYEINHSIAFIFIMFLFFYGDSLYYICGIISLVFFENVNWI